MGLFALVLLGSEHPVRLWLPCRTFPSVGSGRLFLPLVHLARCFISVAASYIFHALGLHATQVCPTRTCCLPGPREETLPPGKALGWVGILLSGRGNGLKPILLYHSLADTMNFTLSKKHCRSFTMHSIFSVPVAFAKSCGGYSKKEKAD